MTTQDTKHIPEWWRLCSIQDLVDEKVLDKPIDWNHWSIHPKTEDFVAKWVPFIMASDIINNKINYKDCAFISEEQNNSLQKWFSIPWDVLLSHKATIWRTTIVGDEYSTITLTPQLTYYRVLNKSELSNRYLFYYFNSSYFQNLLGSWAGSWSTRSYLWITDQRKLSIHIPPVQEQRAIADILSSFDAKIELLREQNETLEKTAQTIFQEWFGRYSVKSPEELPEGWRVGKVSDCMEIIWWWTPKTITEEYWNGNIPWFSVVDCPSNGVFVLETEKNITKKWLDESSTKILPIHTTIITARWTVGKLALTWVEMAMNQSCYWLQSITGNNFYLFLLIQKVIQILRSRVHWAVFDTITKDTFSDIDVITPDTQSLVKFEEIIKQIFEKIFLNTFQMQSLSKTRDELLPRLMSGEVRV